jgi:hypothetical protein
MGRRHLAGLPLVAGPRRNPRAPPKAALGALLHGPKVGALMGLVRLLHGPLRAHAATP